MLTFLSLGLILLSSLCHGSADPQAIIAQQILPQELYEAAWIGATSHPSLEKNLKETIERSKTIKADSIEDDGNALKQRLFWGWIDAVSLAEELLQRKRFEEWPLHWVVLIGKRLSRLQASTTKKESSHAAAPIELPGDKEENKELSIALQQELEKNYAEMDKKHAATMLETPLKQCQQELVKLHSTSDSLKKELDTVFVAALFQYRMSKMLPFDAFNQEAGRLFSSLILAQAQLPIIHYPSATEYAKALMASVNTGDPLGFCNYVLTIYGQQRPKAKLLAPQATEEKPQLTREELVLRLKKELGSHAEAGDAAPKETLGQRLRTIAEAARKQKEEPASQEGSTSNPVAQASAETTEQAVPEEALEGDCAQCPKKKVTNCCAKCRTTFYCSRECQTTHWKAHKPVCIAK